MNSSRIASLKTLTKKAQPTVVGFNFLPKPQAVSIVITKYFRKNAATEVSARDQTPEIFLKKRLAAAENFVRLKFS